MTPRTALLLLVLSVLAAGCIRIRLAPSAPATPAPAATPSATLPAAELGIELPDVALLAPSPTSPPQRYTVQPGDTLASIAQRYGVSVEDIIKTSRLRDPDRLAVGDMLLIPSKEPAATPQPGSSAAPTGRRYTVQAGDTLVSIAERFGVSAAAIIRASKLSNPDRLAIGDTLVIPEPEPASDALRQPARRASGAAASDGDARDDTSSAAGLARATSAALPQRSAGAAPPQRQPAPTPQRRYTVQEGDTLWDIAARHGVSPAALQAANDGVAPERLRVGQTLIIP